MLPSTFCTNVPLVLSCSGSLTPQGRPTTGCITPLPVVPSLSVVRGRRPEGVISELNGWPTLPLSTLHVRSHDRPHMTRGHNGAAPPFMWGTFTPCSMPVYPGAFTTSPRQSVLDSGEIDFPAGSKAELNGGCKPPLPDGRQALNCYAPIISFNPSMIRLNSSAEALPIFCPSRSMESVLIWLILT